MRMGQVGRPFQRFCPFSSPSPPPGNGGLNLLVWVNMQGGHGLQKPELETARKEDLYIRAVRIVARDGGLGPAGDGGLNEKRSNFEVLSNESPSYPTLCLSGPVSKNAT